MNHEGRAFQLSYMVLLELRKRAAHSLSTASDQLRHFFVRQGQFDAENATAGLSVGSGFQQESGEAFRYGVRQPNRANQLVRVAAIVPQMLCSMETGIAVLLEETKKILRFTKFN